MMYSDYYTLSVCAYSIIFAPFIILAQERFAHILQNDSYSLRNYFKWLGHNFFSVFMPLIGIFALALLGISLLKAYLSNTYLYDIQAILGFAVEIGYMLILAAICLCLIIIFYKYDKCIKIECEMIPLKCDRSFISLFLCAALIVTALTAIENIFPGIDTAVFFMPLITPLIIPLAALSLNRQFKSA